LARRRHSPDCIPHWANTLWISDNKTATITDTDAFADRRPSAVPGLLSFKQRDRDGVSLRGTRGERYRLTREGRINPSGEGLPCLSRESQPQDGRCIVKILLAIGSCGPLWSPLGLTFFQRRGGFPPQFFEDFPTRDRLCDARSSFYGLRSPWYLRIAQSRARGRLFASASSRPRKYSSRSRDAPASNVVPTE